ncbi:hypothetical protein R1flu_016633 [Riccia fluitans]|uniref:DUF924-domain-containing protein n=1 Tax=Riccia fluitans TaxID=41844 RepID=A0ABD1YQG5_9MARC
MGTLRLSSRVAGWRPVISLCFSREEVATNRVWSVAPPWNQTLNIIVDHSSKFYSQRSSYFPRFKFLAERHRPVFPMMQSVNADVSGMSSKAGNNDPNPSIFTSSAPAVSSSAVQPEDVLQFWYRDIDPQNSKYASEKWFEGGPEFDKEIEAKFGECLKLAAEGALEGWKDSLRGKVALIIVFDQFARNVHRDSPLAFANDEKAQKLTREMIAQGQDKELAPLERVFSYIPLMHSENLEDHNLAVSAFKGLAAEHSHNEHLHKQLLNFLSFEEKHKAVVEKFGRYPSRNKILGRENTPDELEHLSKGAGW